MMQIVHNYTTEVRIILLLHWPESCRIYDGSQKDTIAFFILNVFDGFGRICFGDLWIKYVLEEDTSSVWNMFYLLLYYSRFF